MPSQKLCTYGGSAKAVAVAVLLANGEEIEQVLLDGWPFNKGKNSSPDRYHRVRELLLGYNTIDLENSERDRAARGQKFITQRRLDGGGEGGG